MAACTSAATPGSSTAAVATETVVGSHLVTVDGYSRTIAALGVGESIQSGLFCVGGHSWYIECYPRGQDEESGDWVSVFLCLDHHGGNHEVKASYKFILVGRAGETVLSNGCRHVQTFTSTDNSWGAAEFIQRKALESYLILQDDDCLRIRCDVTVIREPPPDDDELHRIRHFGDLLLATQVGRDVTFVVGGEQFAAHGCVLAAWSSTLFTAELLGTGKQSTVDGSHRHLRVDGVEPRVFRALLHFIYTDSIPLPDEAAADHVYKIAVTRGLLVAADRYGMKRLKLICSDMLCSYINAATAVDTLQLAHRHGCLKLNQACIKFLRGMLDAFNLEETNEHHSSFYS